MMKIIDSYISLGHTEDGKSLIDIYQNGDIHSKGKFKINDKELADDLFYFFSVQLPRYINELKEE